MYAGIEAQRQLKAELVREAFHRLAKVDLEKLDFSSGEPWQYRSRIQIHKEGNVCGFKARASHRVIPVVDCPIVDKALLPLLAHPPNDEVRESLARLPDGRWNAVASDGWRLEGQDKSATVNVAGKRLTLSLSGFFQSNLGLLPQLIDYVVSSFTPKDINSTDERASWGGIIADLYCGAGLFGAFLAAHFDRVICVEENQSALTLARLNVVGPLHEFHAVRVENWLDHSGNQLLDVVVDPPRTGLSPLVREALVKRRPQRLVYVSCNPDTLARDTGYFLAHGYRLKDAHAFDFYPQTTHIEAAVRLVYEG